jgi:hypothetical protein
MKVSPNFTLDSVADSNYRGKCDVGGFLIFEWTLVIYYKNDKENISDDLVEICANLCASCPLLTTTIGILKER